MNNILEYKGYHTKVEFVVGSMTLRGIIEGINDFVDFECSKTEDVEQEFHNAVDDYLEFCEEVGKAPEKEYKGSFNVRIAPEYHKKLAWMAYKDDCSLNCEVEKAIKAFVDNDNYGTKELTESVKNLTEMIQMENYHFDNENTVSVYNTLPFAVKHCCKYGVK